MLLFVFYCICNSSIGCSLVFFVFYCVFNGFIGFLCFVLHFQWFYLFSSQHNNKTIEQSKKNKKQTKTNQYNYQKNEEKQKNNVFQPLGFRAVPQQLNNNGLSNRK
jgi:hypothetical protein